MEWNEHDIAICDDVIRRQGHNRGKNKSSNKKLKRKKKKNRANSRKTLNASRLNNLLLLVPLSSPLAGRA